VLFGELFGELFDELFATSSFGESDPMSPRASHNMSQQHRPKAARFDTAEDDDDDDAAQDQWAFFNRVS
jgi:hypothetical protein